MAKKAISKLKLEKVKNFSKVIRMVRSPKTNAYVFKEDIIPADAVQDFLKKK